MTLTPKNKESTLHFIRRCKETALSCNFDNPSQEVMAKALAMCISDKFQERAVSASWTNASLAEAETWLIQQEQLQVRKKEIQERFDQEESGHVKEVKTMTSPPEEQRPCNKCGRRHSPDADCPAKFKNCLNCSLTGHFAAMCHQPNQFTGFAPRGFNHRPQMQGGLWRGGRFQYGQGRGSFQNLRANFADYGPRPPAGYNQGQNTTQYGQQMQGNRGRWNGGGRGNWQQGQSRGFPSNQRGNWYGQASTRGRIRSIEHQSNNEFSNYPYPEPPSQSSSSSNPSNTTEKEEDDGIQDDFYTAVRSIKRVE